jgi:hypothetical protein
VRTQLRGSLAAMPSSYITRSAQDRPVAQARILEAIGIRYSKLLSIEHDLFLLLKRKVKELESG